MRYTLHELQHTIARPLAMWAEASHALFTSPLSPFSYLPHSNRMVAGSELLARAVRRYEKPAFGLTHTPIVSSMTSHLHKHDVAVLEEVAMEKPFCRLLHFKRAVARHDPKVLLVAPLSGHYATLLRDTVRALLPAHDVYVTDWIDARQVSVSEGAFHFADYVTYMQEFMRYLMSDAHEAQDLHVMSVCQPTVPVLAAVSLMAEAGESRQPNSIILMGGPIDTRVSPTEVNDYAKAKPLSWFEANVIERVPSKYPGASRRVYPGFLQHAGFIAMNHERHVQAHIDFYNHLVDGDGDSADAHRKFYDEYNAVMDLPAEYYLETIKGVFQEHLLPRGLMKVDGKLVHPEAICKTALMTVEGELDDISGVGQTKAAHDLCCNIPDDKQEYILAQGVGHYGIFSGRRWREIIYPQIHQFILNHRN